MKKNRILVFIFAMLFIINVFSLHGIVFAQNESMGGIVNTKQEEKCTIETNDLVNIWECCESSMILMHNNGLTWEAKVKVHDLCENWDNIDVIVPVETYQISVSRDKSGDINLIAPGEIYKTGDTAIITIKNDSMDDALEIPVNFTCKESVPTFASWEQAQHFFSPVSFDFRNSDVIYIDTLLQPKVELSESTIETFNTISSNRIKANKDFGINDKVAIKKCGKVDNSDSFFLLTRNSKKWMTSISIYDINKDWDAKDIITITTVFDTNIANGIISFSCDDSVFSEGETVIVLIENISKKENKEIFLNCSNGKTLSFPSDEKAHLFGIWDTDKYSVVDSQKRISSPKSTTPTTKYKIYNASGALYSNTEYSNPFAAIKYVTDNRLEGYTVKQTNDLTVVFKLQQNVRTTFYKFQFTQYYGSTNQTGAQQWYNGYGHIHLVRSDGIFGYNTQITNSQPYAHSHSYYGNTPASYLLEGTTGGYVATHALSYNGYRVMKGTVELSNADVYKGGMAVNPYTFITSTTSDAFCDLGLIYIDNGYYDTGWYLCKNSSTNGFSLGTVTCVTPACSPKNVELTYTYATGSVSLSAKNIYTGTISYIDDYSPIYDAGQTYVGLAAITSFVPDVGSTSNGLHAVADIKSGAYFKNVVWSNIRVSSTVNGTYTNITPTSSQLNTIVVYDTDSTSYSYSGNTSTTSISYDPTYR